MFLPCLPVPPTLTRNRFLTTEQSWIFCLFHVCQKGCSWEICVQYRQGRPFINPLPALPSPSTLSSLPLISNWSLLMLPAWCFEDPPWTVCSLAQPWSINPITLPRPSEPVIPHWPVNKSAPPGALSLWLTLVSRHFAMATDLRAFVCDLSVHLFCSVGLHLSFWLHPSPWEHLLSLWPSPPWLCLSRSSLRLHLGLQHLLGGLVTSAFRLRLSLHLYQSPLVPPSIPSSIFTFSSIPAGSSALAPITDSSLASFTIVSSLDSIAVVSTMVPMFVLRSSPASTS